MDTDNKYNPKADDLNHKLSTQPGNTQNWAKLTLLKQNFYQICFLIGQHFQLK